MVKINKTNAARLLDKAKIAYELIPYEVDENDLSAVHVAASLGRTSTACSRHLFFTAINPATLSASSRVSTKWI